MVTGIDGMMMMVILSFIVLHRSTHSFSFWWDTGWCLKKSFPPVLIKNKMQQNTWQNVLTDWKLQIRYAFWVKFSLPPPTPMNSQKRDWELDAEPNIQLFRLKFPQNKDLWFTCSGYNENVSWFCLVPIQSNWSIFRISIPDSYRHCSALGVEWISKRWEWKK